MTKHHPFTPEKNAGFRAGWPAKNLSWLFKSAKILFFFNFKLLKILKILNKKKEVEIQVPFQKVQKNMILAD